MTIIKKSFLFIILFVLISFGFCKIIQAESKIYDSVSENGVGKWKVDSQTKTELFGLTYYNSKGVTYSNQQGTEGNQHITVFEMKTDGVNSKLVNWAIQSSNVGYTRTGLTGIAKDYEEKHPGWIVVAGINGDQYYASYGSKLVEDGSHYFVPQPYYPQIIDGESRIPITATGVSNAAYVGIANDGSSDSLVPASNLSNLKLEIIDENGNVIKSFDIQNINNKPSDNETSVWFAYKGMESSAVPVNQNISSSVDNIYIVGDAELAYMNNSRDYNIGTPIDSLFGRGVISSISKEATITLGGFAVETNDNELINELNVGTKIRVQYRYIDERMNNVEACFGYHSVQRMNDEDVTTTAPYDTRRYNRSIFGRKADGTYVLMTVEKASYAGTTHDESNAILSYFGVTEAYQQDGGGSVMALVRNGNGTFNLVNESSDGGKERSIYNGCFFVVRDPGYALYQKDSTRNSLTFTRINDYNEKYISNLRAYINDVEYKLDDSLTIDGLKEDTVYDVLLKYDVTIDGKTITTSAVFKCQTDSFKFPNPNLRFKSTTGDEITVSNLLQFQDKTLKFEIEVNGEKFSNFDSDEIVISNLSKNKNYDIVIEYTVYDDETGNEYSNIEIENIKTNKYYLPKVTKFDFSNVIGNYLTIDFEYEDKDNCVEDYYILVSNGDSYWFEDDPNKLFIEEIENGEYKFTLIIEYKKGSEKETITLDKIYNVDFNEIIPEPQDSPKKCGKKAFILINCLIFVTSYIYVFRKEFK